MAGVELTEKDLSRLKLEALGNKAKEVSQQLGDPSRYFSSFKAKRMLDASDCENIKSCTTSEERAGKMLDIICTREGKHGEHPFDVFVKALKDLRVQVHLAKILNQELARLKSEQLSSLKAREEMHRDIAPPVIPQDYTSNTGPFPVLPRQKEFMTRGPSTSSSSASSSSSSLSASSPMRSVTSPGNGSHISSPFSPYSPYPGQVPSTAGSQSLASLSSEPDPENGPAPKLPFGYDEDGRKLFQNTQVNGMSSLAGPLPPLPEGYSDDGKKKMDNGLPSEGNGKYPYYSHSNGEYPPHRTSTGGTTTSSVSDDIFAPPEQSVPVFGDGEQVGDLRSRCDALSIENADLRNRLHDSEMRAQNYKEQLMRVKDEHQRVSVENKKLAKRIKELESHLSLVQHVAGPNQRLRSPIARHEHRASDGHIHASNHHRPHDFNRRTSEPGGLSVPSPHSHSASRPTNLPLGRSAHTHDWENGPTIITPDRYRHRSGISPSSDTSRDGTGYTPRSSQPTSLSVSHEDLLASDDRGSVRSSGSSHTSFDLSSLGNTHGTMV